MDTCPEMWTGASREVKGVGITRGREGEGMRGIEENVRKNGKSGLGDSPNLLRNEHRTYHRNNGGNNAETSRHELVSN